MNLEFEKRSKEVVEALSILVSIDPQIVFLGGSAIQAMLPEQKRLSIDLDISYSSGTEKLIHGLEKAGYKVEKRRSRNPIFVFYILTKNNIMVKLDITPLAISETEKRQLRDFEVQFPAQSYFLASKLSSLAFGTIGRLEEEQIQIIKDIFDINCILENKPNLEKMSSEWDKIISDQNHLRNTNHREVQCAEGVQKTLLKCVDVTPSPAFFITQNSLGGFQDMLVKGKVQRQDLATMAARALLLFVNMNSKFYGIEAKIPSEVKNQKKLEEAEQALVAKQILKAEQLRALKLIAPRALIYLFYWAERKRGDNAITTETPGLYNQTF